MYLEHDYEMMHPQQEILELIKQRITPIQIIDMIIAGEVYDYAQTSDGRFYRGTSLGARIFRSWDVILVKEGFTFDQFGHSTLHGHHPDGDKTNDHQVVSMNASEHLRMHGVEQWENLSDKEREMRGETYSKGQKILWANMSLEERKVRGKKVSDTWANMSPEELKTQCEIRREGLANMSPEAEKSRCNSISKTCANRSQEEKEIVSKNHSNAGKECWANYTPEERETRIKFLGGMQSRAIEFIKSHQEFTEGELNEVAKYKQSARSFLYQAMNNGSVKELKKIKSGVIVYRSLIHEVDL